MKKRESGEISKTRKIHGASADSETRRNEKLEDDAPSSGGAAGPQFPIIGIGASAGGPAAIEAFFSAIPTDVDLGMAFVLVQHLSPDHESILTELVKRYTRMQVFEVIDGMRVEPDCVYIIPPKRDMALYQGSLQLLEPSMPRGQRLPIDFFFRSLAQDKRESAVCIVLSGSGSDGTLGVRAVKGEGGIALAQDPETTQYDSMPRSAIATGLVDYVLKPEKMPGQLASYAARAFGGKRGPSAPVPAVEDAFKKICLVVRDRTGHDFSQYKRTTLVRRIERRMTILQIERIEDYLRVLRDRSEEAEALFHDLIIGVTNFFRDAEAFAALENEVLPKLLAEKPEGSSLRAWICGCSTGEEAYSIAMVLQERLELSERNLKLQVFATDIDRQSVEYARAGIYPANIAADVSAERLARFFRQNPEDGSYRIKQSTRELIVFSEQDLIKDPPLSKLDLISCRNLLIYLNGDLQKKLIPLFHYALNEGGYLFLGNSETVGEHVALFETVDRKAKIFRRKRGSTGALHPVLGTFVPPIAEGLGPRGRRRDGRADGRGDWRGLTERVLLDHYGPTAILVSEGGEILHIYGRTGKYLEPAPGDAELNLLPMAREGLKLPLAAALRTVIARKEVVRRPGLRVKTNGEFTIVDLTIRPAEPSPGSVPRDAYLVVLEEARPLAAERVGDAVSANRDEIPHEADARIAQLEEQLKDREEYLQTTLEEMETSNEELKSSNEELQSVNEELQSTNEELETSKEELQSVNEELATVNAELQNKVTDLSRANNDMNNLLAGTGVGTLFVDHQVRISRFTPSATRIINLIPADIGRPMAHIVSNIVGYDTLVEDVRAVLANLTPREAEIKCKDGAWYLMSIRPYRTHENVIEGAVVTFVDITARRELEDGLRSSLRYAENLIASLRDPILVLDSELRVVSANRAFHRRFGATAEDTKDRPIYELGNGMWDSPELRRLFERGLAAEGGHDECVMTRDFEGVGRRTISVTARPIRDEAGETGLVLVAIEDLTERNRQTQAEAE